MQRQIIIAEVAILIACMLVFVPKRVRSASTINPQLLYTSTTHYDPLAWMRGEDRFSGRTVIIEQHSKTPLLPNFAASADPDVSFSADRILISGKRTANDHWQIWEVTLADNSVKQLTTCGDDCVRPFYLPDDRFVYARKKLGGFALETAPLTGGKASSLTFAPGDTLPSYVLRDGRILFESTYPLGNKKQSELYTVYSDGSGVESYRCDHAQARHSGRELRSGDIVFASAQGLSRFTSALAHEVTVNAPKGEYAGEIAETSSGDWLLARRRRVTDKFRIERLQVATAQQETVLKDDHADLVQPTLVVNRPIPKRHPSALHDWDYANLLCLNAYTSKLPFAEKSVAAVRMYASAPDGSTSLLGTAAVEEDGSFYVRVPADQPLRIELVNASGKTVHGEAGWFWLRGGEQRICVGCHAGPETAPENRTPAVLRRATIPADFTNHVLADKRGGK
jgi:hypothetical protein